MKCLIFLCCFRKSHNFQSPVVCAMSYNRLLHCRVVCMLFLVFWVVCIRRSAFSTRAVSNGWSSSVNGVKRFLIKWHIDKYCFLEKYIWMIDFQNIVIFIIKLISVYGSNILNKILVSTKITKYKLCKKNLKNSF